GYKRGSQGRCAWCRSSANVHQPSSPGEWEERLMTRYVLVAFAAASSIVAAAPQSGGQKVTGYLVDAVCAGNHAAEPGYKESHDKNCNLMAACVKSGYSLVLADNTVLTFDPKGNEQALA